MEKDFLNFWCLFPKSTENFRYFEKKDVPQGLFVSETIDCKNRGYFND